MFNATTDQVIKMLHQAAKDGSFMHYSVMLLSGNDNRERRQEIMQTIKGHKMPKSQCNWTALNEALLLHFGINAN